MSTNRNLNMALALCAIWTGLLNLPACGAAEPGVSTIFESPVYSTSATAEQHFEGNLSLQPNQENLPLFLNVVEGQKSHVAFNWFRLTVNGILIASEHDMDGKKEASIDLSGRLQPGGGQILIDAAGEPGASLSFSITSRTVSLKSLAPSTVQPGQHLVLTGTNFSSNESQDVVYIDSQPVEILSAGSKSITVQVPTNLATGKHTVKAVVDSMSSQPLPFSVSSLPAPVLIGTNYWIAPPGAVLIIKGQNFAPNAANNKVMFKNVQGKIVSATADSLSVVVPNWPYGPQEIGVPISVISNGVQSANALRFNFGPIYSGAWPTMPGDSSSEASQ